MHVSTSLLTATINSLVCRITLALGPPTASQQTCIDDAVEGRQDEISGACGDVFTNVSSAVAVSVLYDSPGE
jgi:hypothetical protein